MPSWGNNDNAANAPYWAVNSAIVKAAPAQGHAAPTAANVAYLFANTTADAYIAGETIGLFGVDANEVGTDKKGSHTGWVLRTEGSGGRAGRVQEEVLVAMSGMVGDNEDVVYPDTIITITSQPSNGSAISGVGNTVTFTVAATSDPAATLTYAWQFYNGSTWAATSTNAVFTGNTSTTLTANAETTTANTWKVRAIVTGTDTGVTATSSNATITIF